MIDSLLASTLGPVIDAEMRFKQRRLAAVVLALGAVGLAALAAAAVLTGWWSWEAVFAVLGTVTAVAFIGLIVISRSRPDVRAIARRVEEYHPDLRVALLTAMDQEPGPNGELSYLQQRLLGEVSEHAVKNRWVRNVSGSKLAAAGWGQFLALIAFCAAAWFLLGQVPQQGALVSDTDTTGTEPEPEPITDIEVAVSPGDVEIEKGSRLVIEATFTGRAPGEAMVRLTTAKDERRIPMNVGLDDTVFSALVPKVNDDGTYKITFEEAGSDEFAITTFEFPALLQADATITPPAYLKEEPKTIADTRKITVMEGSEVAWSLKVNKPIAAAELFGEDNTIIALEASADDPTMLVATHIPDKSQKYRVHLVDDADRSNKRPPWLTVNVKRNLPPELKFEFPAQDYEVTSVQELQIEGEVFDDVGVTSMGFAYQYNGEEKDVVIASDGFAGGEKHSVTTDINMEPLDLEPRDLIAYHFWAEDIDRDGNPRRTTSDMFFAEVRFFDDIIREGAPQQGSGESQGDAQQLLKMQKEVVNAAWKLRRDHDFKKPFSALSSDIDVVGQSQTIVISMIEEAIQKAEDPELKQIYTDARELAQKAADEFTKSVTEEKSELVANGHQLAMETYAKLIEARSRETEISMSKSQSKGASQQEKQRNMNLELKQKELKYEEQSAAQKENQTAEQKENLEVLARLKELARRQEAIAEKIKELQNQLADASEEEKAEIERQLKRLQEEQQELLRDMDDLSEKMDSDQNRANMAEEREKLEETRENVQKAAEKLNEGDLAEAANEATRAQEELEEMQEEFRKKTSNQFAGEVRELRDSARDLVENQEGLSEQLETLAENSKSDPFSTERQRERAEVSRAMSEQIRDLSDVMEEIKTLSEESEVSEPLLSDALYESVREAMTGGVMESLEEARDFASYNRADQARTPEQAAARGIEELAESIESAAEKILGNESDALRLARSELDRLIEQSKDESQRLAQNGGQSENGETPSTPQDDAQQAKGNQPTGSGEPKEEGQASKGGEKPGEGEPTPGAGEKPGEKGEGKGKGEIAKGGEKGESPGEGDGQDGEKGKGKGKGEGSLVENGGKGNQKGKGDSPGNGEGQKGGKGKGKGTQPGEGGEQGEGGQKGQLAQGQQQGGQQPGGQQPGGQQQGGQQQGGQQQGGQQQGGNQSGGGLSTGGDDRGQRRPGPRPGQPMFFDQKSEQRVAGPITGEDYEDWSDTLSNIEEMLPEDDLRNEVAKVLDEARSMRIDFRRDNAPPEAATIEQRITNPLIELRGRISEELAKMNKDNPIAPIDRDPVPSEFRDLVRRYYEELGAGN